MSRAIEMKKVIYITIALSILSGCVTNPPIPDVEHRFDGIWHAYIVPIREEDMTGWCIKEGDFAITVNKSSFAGLNSNYEYAVVRGPGIATLIGDVSSNGLVTGDVLGDYMGASKWFAIMDNNAVGVGLMSTDYACTYKIVVSRKNSLYPIKHLKFHKLLREKKSNISTIYNSDIQTLEDVVNTVKAMMVSGEIDFVQNSDSMKTVSGLINSFGLSQEERSSIKRQMPKATSNKHEKLPVNEIKTRNADDIRSRLQHLKKLRDEGLISSDVYKEQQNSILSD